MMRSTAIAALLGASSILFLPTLPMLWPLLWLIAIVLFFYWRWRFFLLRCLLVSLCAFTYTVWHAQQRLAWQLPRSLENRPVTIQGMIVSLPENGQLHTTFLLNLTRLAKHKLSPKKIRLNWYDKYPQLQVGDVWQLQVKLKRIHGFANPGSFDDARYMLQQNIRANGYVRNSTENKLLRSDWYDHPTDRIRQYLANSITRILKKSPYTPMITALVIGDKTGLLSAQWQVLQRTGTNHLLVIAGLHIGMVAGLVFLIVNILWCFSWRLLLLMPAKQAAAIGSLLIALFYSALAGFSIPTQRALVMMMIFMSTIIFRRYLPLGLGIAIALLMVLLIQPLAVMNIGFWLSFAAVSIIFYVISARISSKENLLKWLRLQVAISLGLVPFTLLLFQNASLIAPLANFVVIPVVGFVIVPLSLLAMIFNTIFSWLGHLLLQFAVWLLALIWHLLTWLAAHPLVAWQQAVYSWWSLAAALIGILILLAPRGFPARWLGLLWCLPLFFARPVMPAMGTVKFTLLDVGQGLASVIETANHVLIFDTGAKFGENFDLRQAVVVPFLRCQGIRKVDMLVISHGDNDHIGGAQSVLDALPVKKILTSVPQRFKSNHAQFCLAGTHWQWDGVKFRFLYPDKNHLGLDNNSSCVLRVSIGKKHILLTGDIEKPSEKFLIQQQTQYLPATIIVAPHHGSKTSSTLQFLQQVKPAYVFYPVGYLNRYHFPSRIVLQRYQDLRVSAFSTVTEGAITVTLSQNKLVKPIGYRLEKRRFWRQDN